MLNRSRQTGLSLVELMVGLVVGLIVVAGAGAMYVTTVRGQTYGLRAAKLNQEMRATMSLIASDVRRAGYWAGSVIVSPGTPPTYSYQPNPYTSASGSQTNISVLEDGTCLMYAYDLDADGAAVEAGEIFGFRFNDSDKAVQMLNPGNGLVETGDCGVGAWGAVTSNDTVVIDSLTFSTTGSQCLNATSDLSWRLTAENSALAPCAASSADVNMNGGVAYLPPASGDLMTEERQMTITMTGHHQSDPTMALTVIETVHLPNNRMFNQP